MNSLRQDISDTASYNTRDKVYAYSKSLYLSLLEPREFNDDNHRKVLVCNILLLFTLSLLIVLDLLVFVNYMSETNDYSGVHPLIMLGITGITLCLFYLSRIGYVNVVSQSIIWILIIGGVYGQIMWGADLPSVILLWSFVITASSILISTRYSFYLALFIGLGTVFLQILASRGIFTPRTVWKTHDFRMDDAIEYSVVFILIAGVSWISNREIFKSLIKAKQAKIELQAERDSLEFKVIQKTEQLQKMQIEKINSMYQLVEFGRISSGLFHDIMTPLNTLDLAILQLKNSHTFSKIDLWESSQRIAAIEENLNRCIQTSKKINDFINLAKRQIQNNHDESRFKIYTEIKNVISILESKARKQNVHIFFKCNKKINLYGSPTLFSHVITNLISNAIDSYEETFCKEKFIMRQDNIEIKKVFINCIRKGGMSKSELKILVVVFQQTFNLIYLKLFLLQRLPVDVESAYLPQNTQSKSILKGLSHLYLRQVIPQHHKISSMALSSPSKYQ